MKRFFLPMLLCGLFLSGADVARASAVPGVDWYVMDATAVGLVRAQTAGDAALSPPRKGMQRIFVEEILKGVETTQVFLEPEGTLKPGESGVALFGTPYSEIVVWPLDAKGIVSTGDVAPETRSVFELTLPRKNDFTIPLGDIKKMIAQQTPDEIGLNGQVVDALLFPEKFKAFAAQDPQRATYVRFLIAIRDLERDIPTFAPLLESRDKETRLAAEARLKALTGATVPAPKDDAPDSLMEWSEAWAKQALPGDKPPEWPPLPADYKVPVDAFPGPLVKAVRENDADAFAKEFAAWLDSGVMRDRQILFARMTLPDESKDNPLFQADGKKHEHPKGFPDQNLVSELFGGMFGAHPRFAVQVAVNSQIPAEQRLEYFALYAYYLHSERFISEQKRRMAFIEAQPPGAEVVKRAVIWEPSGADAFIDVNVRSAAWNRLQEAGDKASVEFVEMVTFHTTAKGAGAPGRTADATARSIKDGNEDFAAVSLQYVRTHRDEKAQEVADTMCQNHQDAVVPIMLQWLKDRDGNVRARAASNLCFYPRKDTAPALIAAINAEPKGLPIDDSSAEDETSDDEGPPVPKISMLIALAQTGDKRGLQTLLAEAVKPTYPTLRGELVRGLSRIGDREALGTLAAIAHELEWIADGNIPASRKDEEEEKETLLYETVYAFLYIQTGDDDCSPSEYLSSNGLDPSILQRGMPLIKKWRKQHAQ